MTKVETGRPTPLIRPGRRLVRRNSARLPAICRDTVGARDEADDLDGLKGRRPWIDRIRSDIADDLGLQGADPTVQVKRQFRFDYLIEAVACRGQILQPASRPAHRAAEVAAQDRNQDLFLIQRRLAAEIATDIRRDVTHTVTRHVEKIGQHVTNDPRDLRRQRQGQ